MPGAAPPSHRAFQAAAARTCQRRMETGKLCCECLKGAARLVLTMRAVRNALHIQASRAAIVRESENGTLCATSQRKDAKLLNPAGARVCWLGMLPAWSQCICSVYRHQCLQTSPAKLAAGRQMTALGAAYSSCGGASCRLVVHRCSEQVRAG